MANYTTSTALLEALSEGGIDYLFANFGSDHAPILEAIAEARSAARRIPKVITCPNEMIALTAAHGHTQLSGRAQAVLVHVDCGTQALGGAVHNAAKGRIPALILAGISPVTQEGEAPGSRNEFIQWIQDAFDQRGIVRGYVRYDNEIRSGLNVKQIVHRALQFAHSDPKGPVYLVAAREALEAEAPQVRIEPAQWPAIRPADLTAEAAAEIANALGTARRPLVVTSHLGRNPAAVSELVRLCQQLGVGVLESVPGAVNYPTDDPYYQGCMWNEQRQNPVLAEADVVLVLDSDVPWIPSVNRPAAGAHIIHIDADPLKQQMPLWYIAATDVFRADVATALKHIYKESLISEPNVKAVTERRRHYEKRHAERDRQLAALEVEPRDAIKSEYLTACIRRAVGEEAIVLSEGVTNFHHITNHMRRTRPGTLFAAGGGSLGWSTGAAIGACLARPEALVVALTGDGSYLFGQPSTVFWMARRYKTPFLQVVYNNGGWNAPRSSMLSVHPSGFGSRAADIDIGFDPPPDYAGIAAAAGGAHAETVRRPGEVMPALERALNAVRSERRAAVIDAWLG